jgi:hypothetical protein
MIEQSTFNQEQEYTQPPPEVIAAQKAKQAETPKRSKKWWFIGGGALFLLILVVAVLLQGQKTPPITVPLTPTPVPLVKSSEMEKELARLRLLVQQADPEGDPFPPPQVDMNVSF